MNSTVSHLRAFLAAHPRVAKVEVMEALGSTPREKGAWMLVSPDAIHGTIGGGQLEFMAIERARALLAGDPLSLLEGEMSPEATEGVRAAGRDTKMTTDTESAPRTAEATPPGRFAATLPSGGREGVMLSIPLGPEIGQCCGGRVELAIEPVDGAMRETILAAAHAEDEALPRVFLFGGGHVGQALARALSLLPVRPIVVETRAEAIEGFPAGVETHLTAVPEEFARDAPAGAAFVVLTHDHALDFLIVAEALRRADAAYVGMIGSATKKATFKSWYLKTADGTLEDFARLVTPIGGEAVRDKRPAVIAALAAAEILTAIGSKAR